MPDTRAAIVTGAARGIVPKPNVGPTTVPMITVTARTMTAASGEGRDIDMVWATISYRHRGSSSRKLLSTIGTSPQTR